MRFLGCEEEVAHHLCHMIEVQFETLDTMRVYALQSMWSRLAAIGEGLIVTGM